MRSAELPHVVAGWSASCSSVGHLDRLRVVADHALHELDVGRGEGGTRQRLDFAGGKARLASPGAPGCTTGGAAPRDELPHAARSGSAMPMMNACRAGEINPSRIHRARRRADHPRRHPRVDASGSSAPGGEMKAAFFRKRRELQHHRREARRRFEQLEVGRGRQRVGVENRLEDRGA